LKRRSVDKAETPDAPFSFEKYDAKYFESVWKLVTGISHFIRRLKKVWVTQKQL
jgi:hypothetical protein